MTRDEFQPRNDRERAMWAFMLGHPRFRYADLMKGAKVTRYFVDKFAAKLRNLGLLHRVANVGKDQYFTVTDDAAAAAYADKAKSRKEGAIWTAMRSLKKFSAHEVLLVIGSDRNDVTEEIVTKYCSELVRADYLAVVQKPRADGRPAHYHLIKNTGPLPPIKRTLVCLVDQNEDRAVYAQGERL